MKNPDPSGDILPSVTAVANSVEALWNRLLEEAAAQARAEPLLSDYLQETILNCPSLEHSLAYLLSSKLDCGKGSIPPLEEHFIEIYKSHPELLQLLGRDLQAVFDRDSACDDYLMPLLFFKGFHALQIYRLSHQMYLNGRIFFAKLLQSRCCEIFCIDIHPAARIGSSIMMDHATGIVIGETAVVEDEVSIMQGVTLGGTGKEHGDRHPKIGRGVLISSGAIVLGNIKIGAGAKIAAGSVVLEDVAAHTTVAGIPAKTVGHPHSDSPAREMDHQLDE